MIILERRRSTTIEPRELIKMNLLLMLGKVVFALRVFTDVGGYALNLCTLTRSTLLVQT